MTKQLALRIDKVGKRYEIGQRLEHRTLRDAIMESVQRPARWLQAKRRGEPNARREQNRIWALRDVSFDVRHGEVLGVLGRNGAGKSTLLKLLSRITKPTTGRIEGYGRVGSLLEVGTGFHPELSGRENIFLNGAILGMTHAEIHRNLDAIVDFSEIERFLDTPVKRYSSGMFVRLAFAVAAHLQPDILIVDEVLAVGDAAFQKKCLGKMGDISQEGRTVIFVSHNLVALETLCPRSVWLEQGQLVGDGKTSQLIGNYLQAIPSARLEQQWLDKNSAPGNEQVRLHRASIRPQQGAVDDVMSVRTPLVLEFEYWNEQNEANLDLSVQLFNEQGTLIFDVGRVNPPAWQREGVRRGLLRDVCVIPGDLLNDGRLRVDLHVSKNEEAVYQHRELLVFDVQDSNDHRGSWYGPWPGVIRPLLDWRTELVQGEVILDR